ncbi:MAG TPA: DUF4118 domain-containing protein [Xanthobacteraceae bacterium]|nr:DUF4118 domain-containing protein [Xanthobacteraceae bacterium]
MWLVKRVLPIAVTMAVVAAVTALLWYAKQLGVGPHHPVFFYLLPIATVAILFGSRHGTLCAIASAACSAYFLYDPLYSFNVTNRLEWGDLICFVLLALMAVKCTRELMRPVANIQAAKSRYRSR